MLGELARQAPQHPAPTHRDRLVPRGEKVAEHRREPGIAGSATSVETSGTTITSMTSPRHLPQSQPDRDVAREVDAERGVGERKPRSAPLRNFAASTYLPSARPRRDCGDQPHRRDRRWRRASRRARPRSASPDRRSYPSGLAPRRRRAPRSPRAAADSARRSNASSISAARPSSSATSERSGARISYAGSPSPKRSDSPPSSSTTSSARVPRGCARARPRSGRPPRATGSPPAKVSERSQAASSGAPPSPAIGPPSQRPLPSRVAVALGAARAATHGDHLLAELERGGLRCLARAQRRGPGQAPGARRQRLRVLEAPFPRARPRAPAPAGWGRPSIANPRAGHRQIVGERGSVISTERLESSPAFRHDPGGWWLAEAGRRAGATGGGRDRGGRSDHRWRLRRDVDGACAASARSLGARRRARVGGLRRGAQPDATPASRTPSGITSSTWRRRLGPRRPFSSAQLADRSVDAIGEFAAEREARDRLPQGRAPEGLDQPGAGWRMARRAAGGARPADAPQHGRARRARAAGAAATRPCFAGRLHLPGRHRAAGAARPGAARGRARLGGPSSPS